MFEGGKKHREREGEAIMTYRGSWRTRSPTLGGGSNREKHRYEEEKNERAEPSPPMAMVMIEKGEVKAMALPSLMKTSNGGRNIVLFLQESKHVVMALWQQW
ncbi:hypothetical protein VNO77_41994 [Canavalia gladiata]|uniref:Uncharacterized protein n=1 Tax=Canavalia gladiata TaxID=3824 RepID=A0AAN9PQM2_CANGL